MSTSNDVQTRHLDLIETGCQRDQVLGSTQLLVSCTR